MPGIQAVGGRKEEENSLNWLYLTLPRKPDFTSVQILWADVCTQKYSPTPLNKETEIKDLKLLLWDIGVLIRTVNSSENKGEGKKEEELKVRKLDFWEKVKSIGII